MMPELECGLGLSRSDRSTVILTVRNGADFCTIELKDDQAVNLAEALKRCVSSAHIVKRSGGGIGVAS